MGRRARRGSSCEGGGEGSTAPFGAPAGRDRGNSSQPWLLKGDIQRTGNCLCNRSCVRPRGALVWTGCLREGTQAGLEAPLDEAEGLLGRAWEAWHICPVFAPYSAAGLWARSLPPHPKARQAEFWPHSCSVQGPSGIVAAPRDKRNSCARRRPEGSETPQDASRPPCRVGNAVSHLLS